MGVVCRRDLLTGAFAGTLTMLVKSGGTAMGDQPTAEERRRRYNEAREKAIATFPFERVQTSGELALSTWQQLKRAGRGFPVVLGGDH